MDLDQFQSVVSAAAALQKQLVGFVMESACAQADPSPPLLARQRQATRALLAAMEKLMTQLEEADHAQRQSQAAREAKA